MKKYPMKSILLALLAVFLLVPQGWATMAITTHGAPKPAYNDSGASKATEFNAAMDAFDLAVWNAIGLKMTNPMTTLGDLIYGGTAGAGTRLVGDTSDARKFLRELSVGGVATAPAWDTLQAGDIPDLSSSYIPVTYTSNIATAVSAYNAVYMNASGEADPAKGDSATTMPCIGICITSVDDLITYQVAGRVTNAGWLFTSLGQPVYVSTASAGALTQTPSSTSGHLNQQVGIARAANVLEIQLGTPEEVGVYLPLHAKADTAGAADTATAATNSTNVGITDDTSTNATMYPAWFTANTGNLPAKVSSSKLSFNPSTGLLTATGFSGPLTGTASGNLTTVQADALYSSASYTIGKTAGCATLADAITTIGATTTTLRVPFGTTATLGADVTTPSTLALQIDEGGLISHSMIDIFGTPTVTYADAASGGTLTCAGGSKVVTIAGVDAQATFKPGQWISPATGDLAGVRRQVAYIKNTTTLYVTAVFHAATATGTVNCNKSSTTIDYSAAHTLAVGDYIKIGSDYYWVAKVTDSDTIRLNKHPINVYSSAATKVSVRLLCNGPFMAGDYQCFTGDGGTVKFGVGSLLYVKPTWWGLEAMTWSSGVAATNTKALGCAAFSAGTSTYQYKNTVLLPTNGRFFFITPFTIPSGVTITSAGGGTGIYGGPKLEPYSGVGPIISTTYDHEVGGITKINQITIGGESTGSISFYGSVDSEGVVITNCYFYGGYWPIWADCVSEISMNQIQASVNGSHLTGDSTFANNQIGFSGNDVDSFCYGVFAGGTSLITNNGIFSDGAAGRTSKSIAIFHSIGEYTTYSNNRLGNNDYGFVAWVGNFIFNNNNIFQSRLEGISAMKPENWFDDRAVQWKSCLVQNNKISETHNAGNTGIAIHLASGTFNQGIMSSNELYANDVNFTDYGASADGGYTVMLIFNNGFVDRHVAPRALAASTTPSVLVGDRFTTADATVRTITTFSNLSPGKQIFIYAAHANNTFDFSGGGNLKGNQGVNWTPAVGDWMMAISDGTNIYCTIYDNTP